MENIDYTIQKVANGWILREAVPAGMSWSGAQVHVFPSVERMAEFIAEKNGEKLSNIY